MTKPAILRCYVICTILLLRGFKQDCPDGQLSKEKILEMYTMILPAGNAKVGLKILSKTVPIFLFGQEKDGIMACFVVAGLC